MGLKKLFSHREKKDEDSNLKAYTHRRASSKSSTISLTKSISTWGHKEKEKLKHHSFSGIKSSSKQEPSPMTSSATLPPTRGNYVTQPPKTVQPLQQQQPPPQRHSTASTTSVSTNPFATATASNTPITPSESMKDVNEVVNILRHSVSSEGSLSTYASANEEKHTQYNNKNVSHETLDITIPVAIKEEDENNERNNSTNPFTMTDSPLSMEQKRQSQVFYPPPTTTNHTESNKYELEDDHNNETLTPPDSEADKDSQGDKDDHREGSHDSLYAELLTVQHQLDAVNPANAVEMKRHLETVNRILTKALDNSSHLETKLKSTLDTSKQTLIAMSDKLKEAEETAKAEQEKAKHDHDTALSEIKGQLAVYQVQHQTLAKENQDLLQKTMDLNNQLEKHVASQKNISLLLNNGKETSNETDAEVQDKLKKMVALSASSQLLVAQLQEKLQASEAHHADQMKALQQTCDESKTQALQALQLQLDQSRKEEQLKQQQELEALKADFEETKQKELEALQLSLDASKKQELDALQAGLEESKQKEIETLQAKLEQDAKTSHQAELEALQEKLASEHQAQLTQHTSEAETALAGAQEKHQIELSALNAKLQTLQTEKESEFKELQTKYEQTQQQIQALQAEKEKDESELKELQSTHDETQQLIQELQRQSSDEKLKLETCAVEIRELKEENGRLLAQIEILKNDTSDDVQKVAQDNVSLKQKLEDIEKERAQFEKEKSDIENQHAAATAAAAAAAAELLTLKTTLQSTKEENLGLQSKIDETQAQLLELQNSKEVLKERISKINEQSSQTLQETQKKIEDLEAKLTASETSKTDAESKATAAAAEVKQLKEQLLEMEEVSREAAKSVMDENERLENRLRQMEESSNLAIHENVALNEEVEMLSKNTSRRAIVSENQQLKSELKVMNNIRQENQNLSEMVECLQAKVKELSMEDQIASRASLIRSNSLKKTNITSGEQAQQEELMRMHTRAQLGLIEYLEGENDVTLAMSRFKKQLEAEMREFASTSKPNNNIGPIPSVSESERMR